MKVLVNSHEGIRTNSRPAKPYIMTMEEHSAHPKTSIGSICKSGTETLDSTGKTNTAVTQNSDQLMLLSLPSELLSPGIAWSFFSLRLTKTIDFGSTDNLVTLSRLGFL